MAKANTTKANTTKATVAKRDVVADLLGKATKPAPKAAAPKAAAPKTAATGRRYADDAKIRIVSAPGHREGSNCHQIFGLLRTGMTVAQYKAARAKLAKAEDMPGTGMPYLGMLVRKGHVKVG